MTLTEQDMKTFVVTRWLVMLAVVLSAAPPVFAVNNGPTGATFQLQRGSPEAEQKVLEISTAGDEHLSTVHFKSSLFYLDDQRKEQAAVGVESQKFEFDAGADGVLVQIFVDGSQVLTNGNSQTHTHTRNTGNATASMNIDVIVRYAGYGQKEVKVAGTIKFIGHTQTLNDNSKTDLLAVRLDMFMGGDRYHQGDKIQPGTAPPVPAGGKISLHGIVWPPLPTQDPEFTKDSELWSITGTKVGGFKITQENTAPPYVMTYDRSGKVEPIASFSQPTIRFYWCSRGTQTATYSVTISGVALEKKVNFDVVKPTTTISYLETGLVQAQNNTLSYGKDPGAPRTGNAANAWGIYLEVNDTTPPPWSTTPYFQQMIAAQYRRRGRVSGMWESDWFVGKDGTNYPINFYQDSPSITQNNNYGAVSVAFGAIQYRMHMPGAWNAGSIAVPIGYMNWQWFGDAHRPGNAATNPFVLDSDPNGHSETSFVETDELPEWDDCFQLGHHGFVPDLE